MIPAWFDISTPDAARARTFYQGLFGWQLRVLDTGYTLVDTDGGIGQAGEGSPYTGVVVYFPVDDLTSALDRAEELGGTRVMDPVPVPDRGRIALFTDPDGNTVGLVGP